MKDLRGTYVHRSDQERRRRRIRGAFLLGAVMVSGALAGHSWVPVEAGAVTLSLAVPAVTDVATLQQEVEGARGELRFATARLERWNRIFGFARKYRIQTDLSRAIYDAAIAERIDPELGFAVVRLESRFDERATSSAGATGLTQLMLATARGFEPDLTKEGLYDRDTNLRIGFRYLRELIKWQKGDVHLALLAYNRGPSAVETARELALDASNGYDRIVLKGYRGRGTLD